MNLSYGDNKILSLNYHEAETSKICEKVRWFSPCVWPKLRSMKSCLGTNWNALSLNFRINITWHLLIWLDAYTIDSSVISTWQHLVFYYLGSYLILRHFRGLQWFQAIHIGPMKWVFLNELDLVKEAYKKEEINYRLRTDFVRQVQRRFVEPILGNFLLVLYYCFYEKELLSNPMKQFYALYFVQFSHIWRVNYFSISSHIDLPHVEH